MEDLLSPGIPLRAHVCGNEQVKVETTIYSEIKETLPQERSSKVINISEYGFSFRSSNDKCNHLIFQLCEDPECMKVFTDPQVTLTVSKNIFLKIEINQEKGFEKDLFVSSKTKDSEKRASFKVAIQVCGFETLTLTRPIVFLKRMQKTGIMYLNEDKFSKEFKNSNSNCQISEYSLVYSDEAK